MNTLSGSNGSASIADIAKRVSRMVRMWFRCFPRNDEIRSKNPTLGTDGFRFRRLGVFDVVPFFPIRSESFSLLRLIC